MADGRLSFIGLFIGNYKANIRLKTGRLIFFIIYVNPNGSYIIKCITRATRRC